MVLTPVSFLINGKKGVPWFNCDVPLSLNSQITSPYKSKKAFLKAPSLCAVEIYLSKNNTLFLFHVIDSLYVAQAVPELPM